MGVGVACAAKTDPPVGSLLEPRDERASWGEVQDRRSRPDQDDPLALQPSSGWSALRPELAERGSNPRRDQPMLQPMSRVPRRRVLWFREVTRVGLLTEDVRVRQ